MIADESDGKPVLGSSDTAGSIAKKLGVRVPDDVEVDEQGIVKADFHGMSVSPMPIDNLPRHRRPPEFGGTGKDPIWGLHTIHLGTLDLKYVPDPNNPSHGFIAPAKDMEYTHYEQCIYDTRDIWCPITKEGLDDEHA
ncbi:hypothetical protein C1O25_16260 [Vibrio diazotrophicus]|uniref:Uncharacterized protein n=2 Tax=Vibrio diazotrophicus TaxID=685 RepID=A0ABX4W7B2_VIBDI|nr:hypothetical protein C1O25_16260 [Vibrio diazotrophicus]